MKMKNDWEKVVRSFIKNACDEGLVLFGASDGEERIQTTNAKEAARHVCACDEGALYFLDGEKRVAAYVVLGNEPFETIADYTVNEKLDRACEVFSSKWENRKTPQIAY